MMPNFAAAAAAGPPCYEPYADSVGSMPHPKYTLHYGAHGAQYIYTAIQGSSTEALEYQTKSSNWQLAEQELCDNHLATQLYNHAQITPGDPVAHPSLTSESITSGSFYYGYDTNISDSQSAFQNAVSADPQTIANEILYNPLPTTAAMQATLQPNVPSNFPAQSYICPAVLEPPVVPPPRRSSRRGTSRRATSASISQSSSSPAPKLRTYKRRNVQVPSELAAMSVPGPTTGTPGHSTNWRCPHCPYVQHNHRSPDFNRHVATHSTLEKAQWVCCGVPVFDARAQGVPESVVHEEPFEYEGLLMVGGCQRTFSRRDALHRHLRSSKGLCFGDASAMYQPGNRDAL
ncbi:hypothetical protein C8Q74DRAFT_1372778 [Fomes fomentarius]|nr:hypothetical protein C8Q74DRAFT_1372778 [Fomes fomentarius]